MFVMQVMANTSGICINFNILFAVANMCCEDSVRTIIAEQVKVF